MRLPTRFPLMLAALPLLIPVSGLTQAQDTTTYYVSDLPLAGNRITVELATVQLEENYPSAWRDGTFTLRWHMHNNAELRVNLLPESMASGSVTQPNPVDSGPYWITFEVDADDSRLDTITLAPVVRIQTDSYQHNQIAGLTYEIRDGQPGEPSDWVDMRNQSNITNQELILARVGETFDLTAGRDAMVHEGASFTRTIRTATGMDRGPYEASGHPGVDASVSGDQLTVSARAPHALHPLHVNDALHRQDFFFITVLEEGTYPPIDTVEAVGGGASSATMEVGAAPHWEATYLTDFLPGETFTASAAIEPEGQHVGTPGELFLVIHLTNEAGGSGWYYQNENGIFRPWDGDLTRLEPAHYRSSLSDRETFEFFTGSLPVGEYMVYVGYMAEQGPLIYSLTPQRINVTEEFQDSA